MFLKQVQLQVLEMCMNTEWFQVINEHENKMANGNYIYLSV